MIIYADDNDANDESNSIDKKCTYTEEARKYVPNIFLSMDTETTTTTTTTRKIIKLNNETDIFVIIHSHYIDWQVFFFFPDLVLCQLFHYPTIIESNW